MKSRKIYVKPGIENHQAIQFETMVSDPSNICIAEDGTQVIIHDNKTWDFFK
jgi:hypothetical protein